MPSGRDWVPFPLAWKWNSLAKLHERKHTDYKSVLPKGQNSPWQKKQQYWHQISKWKTVNFSNFSEWFIQGVMSNVCSPFQDLIRTDTFTKIKFQISTCFGWPFRPPIVVTIMCPVSVPFPSTTVASISYIQKLSIAKSNIRKEQKTDYTKTRNHLRIFEKPTFSTFSSLIFISLISSGSLSTIIASPAGFPIAVAGAIPPEAINTGGYRGKTFAVS